MLTNRELNPAQHLNSQPNAPWGLSCSGPNLGFDYVNPFIEGLLKKACHLPSFVEIKIIIAPSHHQAFKCHFQTPIHGAFMFIISYYAM